MRAGARPSKLRKARCLRGSGKPWQASWIASRYTRSALACSLPWQALRAVKGLGERRECLTHTRTERC